MRSYKVKDCNRIHGLSFTPDGRELLVLGGYEASGIDTAAWLDLDDGVPARRLSFLADRFLLTPDNSRLIVGGDAYSRSALKNLVRWLDPRTPKARWTPIRVVSSWPRNCTAVTIDALALTGDDPGLAVAFSRQSTDPGDRREPIRWNSHLAVGIFKPGRSIVLRDLDRPIHFLASTPDGSRWTVLTGEDPPAVASRGAVASLVQVCEKPGTRPLASYRLPTSQTSAPVFSPDGQILAVPNFRTVYLLDSNRLCEVSRLEGHSKKVNAIGFMPDGRRLVTASHDETVRVWDMAARNEVKVYDWKIGLVSALAIAPDGLTCAAGGTRGRIVVWDAEV